MRTPPDDPVAELSIAWRLRTEGLEIGAAAALGEGLLASWAEPHRAYHNLRHLQAVLHHVEGLADHAADIVAVTFAAWYHDAVYRGQPDDEECSAQRAERELTGLGLDPALVAEVARLVRLTVTHNPLPTDRNGAVLCDADLAILAADAGGYAQYVAAVRVEYAHLSDAAFRAGRAAVLRALLAQPALYRTEPGRARWESAARANLRAELAVLS